MASAEQIDLLRQDARKELETQPFETLFHFEFTEADCLDLASGYVPNAIKAMMIAALDWAREDQRRADRPVQDRKPRRKSA